MSGPGGGGFGDFGGPPPGGGFGGGGGYGSPPGAGGYGSPPGAGGYGSPPGAGGYGSPPGGGFGPPRMMAAGPPEHEFGEPENQVIRQVALWAKGLAIAFFVYGGLSLVGCNVLSTLTYIAIGIPLLIAGNAFSTVADTRGRDISNMMNAISTLGTFFLVRIIAMIVMVVIALILVVLMIAFMGMLVAFMSEIAHT